MIGTLHMLERLKFRLDSDYNSALYQFRADYRFATILSKLNKILRDFFLIKPIIIFN